MPTIRGEFLVIGDHIAMTAEGTSVWRVSRVVRNGFEATLTFVADCPDRSDAVNLMSKLHLNLSWTSAPA